MQYDEKNIAEQEQKHVCAGEEVILPSYILLEVLHVLHVLYASFRRLMSLVTKLKMMPTLDSAVDVIALI